MKNLIFLALFLAFSCNRSYQDYKVKFDNGVSKVVSLPKGYSVGDTVNIEVKNSAPGDGVVYSYPKVVIVSVLK